jgi:endonuclease G
MFHSTKVPAVIFFICLCFSLNFSVYASGRKDSDHATYATSEELSKQNNAATTAGSTQQDNATVAQQDAATTPQDATTAQQNTATVQQDTATSQQSTTTAQQHEATTQQDATATQQNTATEQNTTTAQQNATTAPQDISSAPVLLSTLSSLEVPLCPATRALLNGTAPQQNDAVPSSTTTTSISEPNTPGHEVHSYTGFELCYREEYEEAEWVAYCLTKAELTAVTGRTNDFRADTKITTGSATPQDYTRSGYDRGHLAPAADMEWSERSAHDSFLMSNMTPQAPQFNRGMWKELEEQVRLWAETFGEVYVVTGPVLEKKAADYKHIGADEVTVPDYFYKVLLAQLNDESHTVIGIGFILPNKECTGTIYDYAVTIDEVERRTNLDFFSPLPDPTENTVEAQEQLSYWK